MLGDKCAQAKANRNQRQRWKTMYSGCDRVQMWSAVNKANKQGKWFKDWDKNVRDKIKTAGFSQCAYLFPLGVEKKKKLGPQLIYCRLGQVIAPITDYSLNVGWIVWNKAFTELHIEQINYCCRQKQTKDTQTWVKGKWEKCTSFRRFWNMLLFESVWKRERKRRELQREILREISLKTDRD